MISDVPPLSDVADLVVFDFDGPLCRPFELSSTARAAEDILAVPELSCLGEPGEDAFTLLRRSAALPLELRQLVDQILTQHETRGCVWENGHSAGIDLARRLQWSGVSLAVASNNAEGPIRQFLYAVDLPAVAVAGRVPGEPGFLKPHPDCLRRAMLGHDPARTVFIGDTPSDVVAGSALGVMTLALAKRTAREGELARAGATWVVTELADVRA